MYTLSNVSFKLTLLKPTLLSAMTGLYEYILVIFLTYFFPNRVKEQRNAAFELASLAATGEEAKHKIVQNGGYVISLLGLYTFLFLNCCQ